MHFAMMVMMVMVQGLVFIHRYSPFALLLFPGCIGNRLIDMWWTLSKAITEIQWSPERIGGAIFPLRFCHRIPHSRWIRHQMLTPYLMNFDEHNRHQGSWWDRRLA